MTAPYPADTRAKGWRFELDYEQIEQSTTWARTKPEARPWLLMLWLVAWKQVPCGSLPDDPEAIAGAIGIPDDLWERHRASLLRGWWSAEDGRLYHDTLVKRVFEMMAKRRSDADRQAGKRARDSAAVTPESANVTRDSPVTPPHVTRESDTDNRILKEITPTPTASPPLKSKSPVRPEDVSEQVWNDWNELRRKKRAPVTETVLTSAMEEAAKARMPLDRFLAVWCARGSQGLQAEWLKPDERSTGETAFQRNARERVAEMSGGLVSAAAPGTKPVTLLEVIQHGPYAIGSR